MAHHTLATFRRNRNLRSLTDQNQSTQECLTKKIDTICWPIKKREMSVLEDREKIIALIVSDRVNGGENNVFEYHVVLIVSVTQRYLQTIMYSMYSFYLQRVPYKKIIIARVSRDIKQLKCKFIGLPPPL